MQRSDLRSALAHFMLLRSPRHALGMTIDNENTHAAMPGLRVGASEYIGFVRHRGIVNPQFRSGEPPAIGRVDRCRLDAGNIRTRFGFGNAIGNPLSRGENVGQVFLLLRLAAM
jgi:hypothetical protein